MPNVAIILNGPPGSGKDTLANYFTQLGFVHMRFKETLYKETLHYFGLTYSHMNYLFMGRCTDRHFKDVPWEPLRLKDGTILSPRQALIYVSEEVIKPERGNNFFGLAAAQEAVAMDYPKVIFSDGGFTEEVQEIDKVFKQTLIFRLKREGFTWGDDSRTYYNDGTNVYDVQLVQGSPILAVREILMIATNQPHFFTE